MKVIPTRSDRMLFQTVSDLPINSIRLSRQKNPTHETVSHGGPKMTFFEGLVVSNLVHNAREVGSQLCGTTKLSP